MTSDLKAYPLMKETGVPWLGRVPAHWDVEPIARIGLLFKGRGGSKEDEVTSGVPCVRYGDLYTRHEFFINSTKACVSSERALSYTRIRYGDVLFAASGETFEDIGRSAVNLLGAEAVCGGDVILLRPNRSLNPRFLGYVADAPSSRNQKASMGRGFTVVHIYASELKRLVLAIPPLAEQAAIARFLDHADQRIRHYIRAKQRQIKLLEEQKRAIIHRAVTQGVDPDVRLKPSGVWWLGDIPVHWEISRSRHLFTVRTELARPDDVQLSATQAYGVIPQAEFESRVGRKVVRISMHLDKRRHVERGDFIISMRSFQGGLERAWASGAIRSSYVVLKPEPDVDIEFFSYVFKSREYIGALQATADFIRDGQDLTFDNFRRVDLPRVPLDEQKAIARFIAASTQRGDLTASKITREIALLREYRTRLIADIVTGRLDVREAAAQLPESFEEPERPEEADAELDTECADHGLGAVTDEVEA
jgi:type I restriction enzyme, S subunit